MNRLSVVDIHSLEGWLVKKKSKETGFSLMGDNRRWFKVLEVKGAEQSELAWSYFQTQRTKDAKGWIYLKDVTEIYDDGKSFTVASPARTICVSTQNQGEHKMWLKGLVQLCPRANISRITTELGLDPAEEKSADRKTVTVVKEEKAVYLDGRYTRGMHVQEDDVEDAVEAPEIGESKGEHSNKESGGRRSRESSRERQQKVVSSNSSEDLNAPSRTEREDHRVSSNSYRATGGVTSRLHSHITGNTGPAAAVPANSLIDEEGRALDLSRQKARNARRSRVAGENPDGYLDDAKGEDSDHKRDAKDDDLEEVIYDEGEEDYESEDDKQQGPSEPVRGRLKEVEGPAGLRPVGQKMKKAPPTVPPPRRAADMANVIADDDVDDEAKGVRKQSMDAILNSYKNNVVAESKELEHEVLDMKAEKERREIQVMTVSSDSKATGELISPIGSSRPPRPPMGAKQQQPSNSASKQAKQPVHHSKMLGRSSTPPRKHADPGTTVDSNFVDENWDDEDSPKKPTDLRNAGVSAVPGVRADPNFLEENFDDD